MFITSLKIYSQKLIVENKDTLLCFEINQGKYILKQLYSLKECEEIRNVCEQQVFKYDSLYNEAEKAKKVVMSLYRNCDDQIFMKEIKIKALEKSLNQEYEKTSNEKRNKKTAIILGILSTSFMTYLWITK